MSYGFLQSSFTLPDSPTVSDFEDVSPFVCETFLLNILLIGFKA